MNKPLTAKESGRTRAGQRDASPPSKRIVGISLVVLLSGLALGLALYPEPTTNAIVGAPGDSILVDPVAVNGGDPVVLYGVDAGSAGSEIREVAAGTGGEVLEASTPDEIADRVDQVVDDALATPPYAWVGEYYAGRTGKPITFNGSGSYDPDGALVNYEWDVDGDGVFDESTVEPKLTYTYPGDYQGSITLKVTDDSGRTATATTSVDVSIDADGMPAADDNCPIEHNPGQDDKDLDGIGDLCDPDFVLPTEDAPGVDGVVGAETSVTASR